MQTDDFWLCLPRRRTEGAQCDKLNRYEKYLLTYENGMAYYREMKNSTNTDTVSFTVKGQVVIPRKIRREFEIEEGTQAIVQTTAEGILLKPITAKYIRSLRGKYKHLDLMKGLTESRKEDRQRDW